MKLPKELQNKKMKKVIENKKRIVNRKENVKYFPNDITKDINEDIRLEILIMLDTDYEYTHNKRPTFYGFYCIDKELFIYSKCPMSIVVMPKELDNGSFLVFGENERIFIEKNYSPIKYIDVEKEFNNHEINISKDLFKVCRDLYNKNPLTNLEIIKQNNNDDSNYSNYYI